MPALYITSISGNSGKTMIAAGLGQIWQEHGKKVGYLRLCKPGETELPDEADARFMQKALGLSESPEAICLGINAPADKIEAVRQVYSAASSEKDIVIIEGLPLKDSAEVVETLDARIIAVHDYTNQFATALPEYKKFGNRLLGVVVNKVPRNQVARVRSRISAEASQAGISLSGLIPEHRLLMTLSIGELAQAVQGKILNNPDKADELIESFMMGSSTFDRGPAYYKRKENKAVILWGERPGFRKAALAGLQQSVLQTSVRCIVITANGVPLPAVAQKAEEKQVPVISAPGTMPELIVSLEKTMERLKFNQEKKLPYLKEVLQSHMDLELVSGLLSG